MPFADSLSLNSFATPLLSSHAWQRNRSYFSGNLGCFTMLSRTGARVRISAGVYNTVDPEGDHFAFFFILPDDPNEFEVPEEDVEE